MKLLILFVAVAQVTLGSKEWEQFKIKYEKNYKNEEEEAFRRNIFVEKLQLVKEHNKKYEQGLYSYTLEINKFADLTKNEIFSATKPNDEEPITISKKILNHRITPREEVPDSIDWRDYGVITPVLDQYYCETCWAFAVTATIEAHMAIYKNINVTLSQQNLADCVDPNFTCETDMRRDIIEAAYQYIIDNNGVDTSDSYPYEYYAVGSCRFNPENVGATITGYANVTEGDEEDLKRIVGTIGPVTVAITTDLNWSLYKDGIYYDPDCMNEDLIFNHAVVVVGYGSENGEDYWLVKNSWGTWFAENGYIRMARNKDNNCGIASIARYPVL